MTPRELYLVFLPGDDDWGWVCYWYIPSALWIVAWMNRVRHAVSIFGLWPCECHLSIPDEQPRFVMFTLTVVIGMSLAYTESTLPLMWKSTGLRLAVINHWGIGTDSGGLKALDWTSGDYKFNHLVCITLESHWASISLLSMETRISVTIKWEGGKHFGK